MTVKLKTELDILRELEEQNCILKDALTLQQRSLRKEAKDKNDSYNKLKQLLSSHYTPGRNLDNTLLNDYQCLSECKSSSTIRSHTVKQQDRTHHTKSKVTFAEINAASNEVQTKSLKFSGLTMESESGDLKTLKALRVNEVNEENLFELSNQTESGNLVRKRRKSYFQKLQQSKGKA